MDHPQNSKGGESMTNYVIYKNPEARKKAVLMKEIESLMNITYDNLCIFLATQDSNNKPDYIEYNKKYKLESFCLDKREDPRIFNPWPSEIQQELTVLKNFGHIIWISKRIGEAEDIHFAWIYSHELQHLNQSLNNPVLLIVSKLIHAYYRDFNIGKDPNIDNPVEFDSELTAKRILIQLYGEEKCNTYLGEIMAKTEYNHRRYGKLLDLDINTDFDVEHETQKIICENQPIFKQIEERRRENSHFTINIHNLCSCENPHKAIKEAVEDCTTLSVK